jgi:hypothetical protein
MPEPGRVKVSPDQVPEKSGELNWMGRAWSKKNLIAVYTKQLVSQPAFIA